MPRWIVPLFVAFLVGGSVLIVRKDVRQFSKYVLNPFALWVAARRPMYYGIIRHVGRRSGQIYTTPVVPKLTPDGVIIPLPYGPETDWCRNVISAGNAMLTLNGTEFALSSPEIVGAEVAAPLVPAATARVWQWIGIDKYLRLKLRQVAASSATVAAA